MFLTIHNTLKAGVGFKTQYASVLSFFDCHQDVNIYRAREAFSLI